MPSINAYLTDVVVAAQKFKSGAQNRFLGMTVHERDFRWCVTVWDDRALPPELEAFVEDVSLHVNIHMREPRELGDYKHETAACSLKLLNGESDHSYEVDVRAKKLAHAGELLHQIRLGTIRPFRSYDKPQGGKSYAELVAEVARLEAEVVRLSDNARHVRNAAAYTESRLTEFCDNVRWFWSRTRIRTAILTIVGLQLKELRD